MTSREKFNGLNKKQNSKYPRPIVAVLRQQRSVSAANKNQFASFPTHLLARLSNHQRGRLAESLVKAIYLLRGYVPLSAAGQQRLQRHVQLDLMVRRGRQLVIVEVKYRHHTQNLPFALHPAQQARLRQALAQVAANVSGSGQRPVTFCRCDLALIGPKWPFVKILTNITA